MTAITIPDALICTEVKAEYGDDLEPEAFVATLYLGGFEVFSITYMKITHPDEWARYELYGNHNEDAFRDGFNELVAAKLGVLLRAIVQEEE